MPIYQINNVSETVKVGIWKITEPVEELLLLLTEKGISIKEKPESLSKSRILQWFATRILLAEFIEEALIVYDDLRKPYLDNGWNISISHSNDFVAIILNKDKDCGIDIEKISSKVERIKHKFLNPLDLKNVTSLCDLTAYWSAKEALYKYYGKKEVLFIENLFIENFYNNISTFNGKIDMPDFKITLPMTWEKIEDYVLVYTT